MKNIAFNSFVAAFIHIPANPVKNKNACTTCGNYGSYSIRHNNTRIENSSIISKATRKKPREESRGLND